MTPPSHRSRSPSFSRGARRSHLVPFSVEFTARRERLSLALEQRPTKTVLRRGSEKRWKGEGFFLPSPPLPPSPTFSLSSLLFSSLLSVAPVGPVSGAMGRVLASLSPTSGARNGRNNWNHNTTITAPDQRAGALDQERRAALRPVSYGGCFHFARSSGRESALELEVPCMLRPGG